MELYCLNLSQFFLDDGFNSSIKIAIFDTYEKAENFIIQYYLENLLDGYGYPNNIYSDYSSFNRCICFCPTKELDEYNDDTILTKVGVYKKEKQQEEEVSKKLFKFFTWNSDTKEYEISEWVSEEKVPKDNLYLLFEYDRDMSINSGNQLIFSIHKRKLNDISSYTEFKSCLW